MDRQIIIIALILIPPGIYIAIFSLKSQRFYQEEQWKDWGGRAALVGGLLSVANRIGGPLLARILLASVGLACVGVGIWALATLL